MARNPDGNLVNPGNFKSDGVNGNDWNPDNSNTDLGVSLSRSLGSALTGGVTFYATTFNPTS